MQTLPAFDDPAVAATVVAALRAQLAGDGRDRRERELVISRVDGIPVGDSPHREALLRGGFAPGYRGLVLR
jgi:predicted Zn-dependent protease